MELATQKRLYPRMSDVLDRVGNVSPVRVFAHPQPGTGTVADLVANLNAGGRPWELVDGIVVEKRTRYRKNTFGARVARAIRSYLTDHDLGFVLKPDTPIRLGDQLVRSPDVSFVTRDRLDALEDLLEPGSVVFNIAPDLVVDVIGPLTTEAELRIKLHEYTGAGVQVVWYVDPIQKRVTSVRNDQWSATVLGMDGVLGGASVLPGFMLPITMIFEKLTPVKKSKKRHS